MKKILLIALGELSTGELIIAHAFAMGLDPKKYLVDLLIPEKRMNLLNAEENLQIFGISDKKSFQENKDLITTLINKNVYDLFILFDAYTFEYAQKWTGIDLDTLKAFDIPIASLDEYDYSSGNYKIDYYGLIVKKLPDLFSKIDYVLKNCPLSMPDGRTLENNSYYYKVLPKLEYNLDNMRKSREEHSQEDEKIVFFTLSDWELNGSYSFLAQKKLTSELLPIVYNYLDETGIKVHLIHVGASIWKEDEFNSNTVRYSHYNSLPIEEFETLLSVSDLFITYNIVSITLTKAIEYNVNSIVLNNDKVLDFRKLSEKLKEKPDWYQKMARDIIIAYPFKASMFSWSKFLSPILKNNIYVDTFYRLQSFHTKSVIETMQNVLNGNENKEKEKYIVRYKEAREHIPGPTEVLNRIFDGIGESYE